MTEKTETAAQLDLDNLEALARLASTLPNGSTIVRIEPATILALIAQARAQPAAAPIAPSVNSGEGAPSDDVEQRLRAQAVTPFGPEGFALLTEAAQRIADLRAQFATTTANLQTAVQEAWKANAQLAQQRQAAAAELASMERMFLAAATDLGLINEALGLDPDDGGAEPILAAIEDLKAAPHAQAEPVAWIRKTDITELTDSEPETNGWTPLYAAPAPQEAEQASASSADEIIEKAARYDWIKARVDREGRDGGWTGYFRLPSVDGWDDTPYAEKRGEGFHHADLDAAIDAKRVSPTTTKG